jgi:hypothetical protein
MMTFIQVETIVAEDANNITRRQIEQLGQDHTFEPLRGSSCIRERRILQFASHQIFPGTTPGPAAGPAAGRGNPWLTADIDQEQREARQTPGGIPAAVARGGAISITMTMRSGERVQSARITGSFLNDDTFEELVELPMGRATLPCCFAFGIDPSKWSARRAAGRTCTCTCNGRKIR